MNVDFDSLGITLWLEIAKPNLGLRSREPK